MPSLAPQLAKLGLADRMLEFMGQIVDPLARALGFCELAQSLATAGESAISLRAAESALSTIDYLPDEQDADQVREQVGRLYATGGEFDRAQSVLEQIQNGRWILVWNR